ncbi:MAG TPA: DUF6356 family protein [Azospirillaceae bacterium]|nr:DUF6356 family protein [Azospirillaceae bacterium]
MIQRLFSQHPASVGETYLGHLAQAFRFGGTLVAAGLACLVHGLLPFLFVTTASKTVGRLHQRMTTHRVRAHHRGGPEVR